MAEQTSSSLTTAQTQALIDILTHRQTYAEIERFKQPDAIDNYGPPFQTDRPRSDSPILQSLLSKFALTLPGLSQVKSNFWQTYVHDLVQELSAAELSESYDKGTLGIRKTVATALSALLEYPARGMLGGLDRAETSGLKDEYDVTQAKDIVQAWGDCLHEIVYGDLLDELFEKAAQTQDLKDHRSGVQAMHEYIVVNLASLIHYTLILSPEGSSLIRMIDMAHRLLPYAIIRQTLRIGNAATMIGGMVRVMLAKVSVASMTNWIGLSAGADEGMNLMQQIISQVLSWDKRELKRRADKIEKDPNLLPKEAKVELKDWISRTRAEHDECRRQSREQGMSIVAVILSLSAASVELTEAQHTKALEYLSLNLAIRDRTEIVKVLCQRNPDHLTAAVREGVDAYTPMIRDVHQAVDLSDAIWDFERFITDMLKVAKPNPAQDNGRAPSVEDFVDLLHNHQASSHKFLHQVAKKGPAIVGWWHTYVKKAAAQFREDDVPPATDAVIPPSSRSQGLKKILNETYDKLNEQDKKEIVAELNAYAEYIDKLHNASLTRIEAVVKKTGGSPYGPGAYLARWQDLLDRTPITPAKENGPVRSGSSKSVTEEMQKDVDGETQGFINDAIKIKSENPRVPSVEKTWATFSSVFQSALGDP